MKDRVCTLSKNDLKDLVKTYRIPLDLHPRLPDPGFTMGRVLAGAIGINFEFLQFFSIQDVCMDDGPSSLKKWKEKFFLIDHRVIPDYLTWRHSCSCVSDDLPTDGYDQNDVERLCAHLIRLREIREERAPSHTTTPATKGAIILLSTPYEIAASLPDSCLIKNASKLDRAKGVDEAGLADLCAKIEDSLERDEGISMRVVSAPTPRLGKRLGAPPSIAVVSAITSGRVGMSGAEVMRCQIDPLDCLARSALARDAEYDQIPDDDFGTATRGEEIDLTLFPLAPSPHHMPYPYEGVSSPLYTKEEKALDQTITPTKLRRTEPLLLLELSNHVNVLSALLVSHGYELNSRYTNLVSSKDLLQEKLNQKKRDVRLLCSEVTSLDDKLEKLKGDYDALGLENKELFLTEELTRTDAKLSEQSLTVRVLQNKLTLEKSKSQGYTDAMDGLREEVAQFVGSGVDGVIQKLLSSDKFHAALARVASLGINYGIERGLRMGRTDVEFEAAVQKVSNFHAGAMADFDKALVDFPTTPFPFLSKIVAAFGGTLFDVAQILLDKFVRLATSVSVAPSSVNEAPEQVSP
ncbi:hypothetical protein Tco_0464575 [Tanacetum coccineum]